MNYEWESVSKQIVLGYSRYNPRIFSGGTEVDDIILSYEGESNENLKSVIIRNTARLSCKLATMILVV